MAENTRVRIEPDIEAYLKSQSERVLSKPGSQLTGAELTTLTNRLLYEHKQAQQLAKALPLVRFFNSVSTWLAGSGGKVTAFQSTEQPALKEAPCEDDNFSFEVDFAAQFQENEAAF